MFVTCQRSLSSSAVTATPEIQLDVNELDIYVARNLSYCCCVRSPRTVAFMVWRMPNLITAVDVVFSSS